MACRLLERRVLQGEKMFEFSWPLFGMHIALAVALFFLVNWIGRHAIDFGYISTTLFEEPNESVALNFFIRALSPAVFIIILSAIFVALGLPVLRLGIVMVAPYYYLVRVGVIFLFNRYNLISWPRYLVHALVGISAAALAYHYLIVPNRSLIPNLETAGNELWLAILAFLYAVSNKIPLSGGPGARRRNSFVTKHYMTARREFGDLINSKVTDDLLKLVAYSVLVYEDYCRPPAIRALERLAWWKQNRTTGILQVSAKDALSDEESVKRGLDILLTS
ncbi:hypothetical protein VB618_11050 [Microvirga sp. CF3062]|uniref:hypothetical protein n=1 Tax=Microvirga sp. CF3062 TaxID=3110182 RepID=UPI002E762F12|nr:hypothetical protein [Microvirga sp. CF3062]MEE1656736.1 hypothetical protein [Microvirga sp. CF3062]